MADLQEGLSPKSLPLLDPLLVASLELLVGVLCRHILPLFSSLRSIQVFSFMVSAQFPTARRCRLFTLASGCFQSPSQGLGLCCSRCALCETMRRSFVTILELASFRSECYRWGCGAHKSFDSSSARQSAILEGVGKASRQFSVCLSLFCPQSAALHRPRQLAVRRSSLFAFLRASSCSSQSQPLVRSARRC